MDLKQYELTVEDVTVNIPPSEIEKMGDSILDDSIIGQPRAVKALHMATEIQAKGYNVFVTGYSGTGRRTAIKKVLNKLKLPDDQLQDVVFVYNFKKPDSPDVLYFPKGQGMDFKKQVHDLIENLKKSISIKLESKPYQQKKDKLTQNIEQRENKILSDFESKLQKENFQIVQVGDDDQQVMDIMPLHEGEPVDFDDLQVLVADGKMEEALWNRMREKYYQYMDEMKKIFKELRATRLILDDKIKELNMNSIKPLVAAEVEQILNVYPDQSVRDYLNSLEEDVSRHIYLFSQHEEGPPQQSKGWINSFRRYGVNVVVDHGHSDHVPVIFENHPSYANLFGSIESRYEVGGEVQTDYMMIRAGSLINGSGGFLVLNAEDILREEASWQALKSVLLTGKVEIQQHDSSFMSPGVRIKPAPVNVKTKVIIIGNPNIYDVLYSMDEDFQKLFKVSAEFDSTIPRNDENTSRYVSFIRQTVSSKTSRKINNDAIGKVVAYGVRLAERKDAITTRFSQIVDIIIEADYWAGKTGKSEIDADSVVQAIDERAFLYNLPEEKIQEMIAMGDILIQCSGNEVGMVNGLAVHDRGYYAFGRPSLISARISPGDAGIINIEREAGLSGEFHDKGILILEGLLRSRYAMKFPLSVTASICFEQSYSSVDGDSASSTEVYALLSAIADLPIRQDLAVTGSINQMGDIQPIGGVTEKVEGFFQTCKARGLTGNQGVIIPRQNVRNLILNGEVVEAVEAGKFHIYAISNIDQGLEILTGIPAGQRNSKGEYPKSTINWHVEQALRKMADKVKEFQGN
ncbi:MAG: AAA family ATPase [Spirochaetales bacterium]|nr:AAA family ATPase [Spirochaetales bacterium]